MRYFKIPFCRIFFEKSENIPDQRVYECRMLGQKLGYDSLSPNELNMRVYKIRAKKVYTMRDNSAKI